MKILSIEPTPSPNTMKVILDEELPMGKSTNYKKDAAETAPPFIKDILQIEGVKGVYHVADFLAVERNAKYDWPALLMQVRTIFGDGDQQSGLSRLATGQGFGEVKVQIQMFKGIPIQIKANSDLEEKRWSMPDEFLHAFKQAQFGTDNAVLIRKWSDYGSRYGNLDQIGQEVMDELLATYPAERLDQLVKDAKNSKSESIEIRRVQRKKLTAEDLDHPDWRERFKALDLMEDPTIDDIPLLDKALQDEKASIRRLAVVYLGMIEDAQVLPYLYKGLKDKSVTVRRTAGDCLSDLGFPEAIPAQMEALKDSSKLVRWRAAMYLYEVGDESALPALREAEDDEEFEVALQVKMAIERIEKGEEALGSVWKQMTEARKGK